MATITHLAASLKLFLATVLFTCDSATPRLFATDIGTSRLHRCVVRVILIFGRIISEHLVDHRPDVTGIILFDKAVLIVVLVVVLVVVILVVDDLVRSLLNRRDATRDGWLVAAIVTGAGCGPLPL